MKLEKVEVHFEYEVPKVQCQSCQMSFGILQLLDVSSSLYESNAKWQGSWWAITDYCPGCGAKQ
ncbi:MAG: hypothetical protein MJA29_00935, partial [Candidatus Omnitrophica bacterium]|nr:hypothetical protein [Candidatus Omnitrophota bacterium]